MCPKVDGYRGTGFYRKGEKTGTRGADGERNSEEGHRGKILKIRKVRPQKRCKNNVGKLL